MQYVFGDLKYKVDDISYDEISLIVSLNLFYSKINSLYWNRTPKNAMFDKISITSCHTIIGHHNCYKYKI